MSFHSAFRTPHSDFEWVAVADIACCDDTFVVTYRPDMASLECSVEQAGVLTPVHLRQEKTGRLQIICGSKRILACQQVGRTEVPALIYQAEDLSEEAALQFALYDNLGCRTLNAVEKGRLLWRLRYRHQYAVEELVGELCSLLDLPPRAEIVEAYCTLVTLDDALQAATTEATLPLETALWIGEAGEADQQTLLTLFTGLRLGQNRARELERLIREICHRDDGGITRLWQELGIGDILAISTLSGPQKVERIRGELRTRRYPQFSAHERKFQEALQDLRLPPQVSWQPPPHFDGHQYQVNFRFGTHEELQAYAKRLLEAASEPALDILLGLL